MFDPGRLPAELMRADDALGARLEDAGLTSSQPPQQAIYDGWLLRYSPGRAKRARSVNALAGGMRPLAEKLRHVEVFYARAGLPCVYRITPFTQPAGLDAALAAAGYLAGEESRVMWLDVASRALPAHKTLAYSELGLTEFADVVARLRGSPATQAAAERQRLAQLALPQNQDSAGRDAVVSFHALNEHIVVSHDDSIQPCFDGCFGDILMCSPTVRKTGVHVKVDDDFLHGASSVKLTFLPSNGNNVPA